MQANGQDGNGSPTLKNHRIVVTRHGRRLVAFGMAATSKAGLRVIPLTLMMVILLKLIPVDKQVLLSPNLAEFAPAHSDRYRETLTELLDLLAAGRIKPLVAERIPLVEATRAHELLERGGYTGKVVLVTSTG